MSEGILVKLLEAVAQDAVDVASNHSMEEEE
jgi:hypothetical protein